MNKDAGLYFDNTRVSRFFECPRAYFFRHVLHLTRPGGSIALTFGSGWHKGMEAIWALAVSDKTNMELVQAAALAFGEAWTKDGRSLDDINLDEKRNPGLALDMFAEYINKYREQIRGYNVLAIERPFIIPLVKANTLYDGQLPIYYIGRWDKMYEDRKRVYAREHKTTSLYRKEGVFAAEWVDSFSPNNQVDGYSYAGYAVYGDAFKGVMVEGAMVHKTVRGFTLVPIQRSLQNLDAWVFEIRYWINEILENTRMLEDPRAAEMPYLPAFPKRTEHCVGKYGRCEYLDFCKYGKANPLQMEIPPGWVIEKWDPFAHNIEDGQEPAIVGSGVQELEVLDV